MSLPEVLQVRLDEIKQKKTDVVSSDLTYIGRADFHKLTSEPVWQILRKTIVDDVESIEYANNGSYTAVWDNRASYFGAFTPGPDAGFGDTSIRQQVLAASDLNYDVTYAGSGTKAERITRVDYTSLTYPGITIRKDIAYTLISGTKYIIDSVAWSVI